MASFLKVSKIKTFTCSARLPFLKIAKLCISKDQKLTKKDHDKQWSKISEWVDIVSFLIPFNLYLEQSVRNTYSFCEKKSVAKQNVFSNSVGINLILKYIKFKLE